MAEDVAGPMRSRLARIAGALDAAKGAPELEACKKDIIALFKQVDAAITDLGALKDDIKLLVDRYKQASAAATRTAAAPELGEKPVIHSDHIGASTFIEKGWSLLSLGDYPGAIQALSKALELAPSDVQAESLLGCSRRTTTTRSRPSRRC